MSIEMTCAHCAKPFTASRKDARFCGERCREWGRSRRCSNHPDRPVRAKGRCSTCYNDTDPDRQRPRPSSPEVRRRANRAKTQRRRAATRGADVEVVHTDVVGDRDGWRCGICRRRVDRTKVYPHPRSPSLDHIVPLSEHGEHSYANTRISHLACNRKRSNRGGGEQLALLGRVG